MVNADEEDFDLQHFALDLQSSIPVLFELQKLIVKKKEISNNYRDICQIYCAGQSRQ